MRTKTNYEVRAQRFCKLIAPFLLTCHEINDYIRAVNAFNQQYHYHVILKHGISRIVLINSNYVVKLDYDFETGFGNCQDEVDIYTQALVDGYGHLFAKIIPFCYQSITFYIMPRIPNVGRSHYSLDHYLDKDEYKYVMERIADIHDNNYGTIGDCAIIIDYACTMYAYYESSEDYSSIDE